MPVYRRDGLPAQRVRVDGWNVTVVVPVSRDAGTSPAQVAKEVAATAQIRQSTFSRLNLALRIR